MARQGLLADNAARPYRGDTGGLHDDSTEWRWRPAWRVRFCQGAANFGHDEHHFADTGADQHGTSPAAPAILADPGDHCWPRRLIELLTRPSSRSACPGGARSRQASPTSSAWCACPALADHHAHRPPSLATVPAGVAGTPRSRISTKRVSTTSTCRHPRRRFRHLPARDPRDRARTSSASKEPTTVQ